MVNKQKKKVSVRLRYSSVQKRAILKELDEGERSLYAVAKKYSVQSRQIKLWKVNLDKFDCCSSSTAVLSKDVCSFITLMSEFLGSKKRNVITTITKIVFGFDVTEMTL